MLIKNKLEKMRFAIIGVINTAIDFGLFMVLGLTGLSAVRANYISTTVALIFSFFANKKYTFRAHGTNYFKEIALFLAFTLFGLWVLQPLAITFLLNVTSTFSIAEWLQLAGAKILATGVTLVWNYLTYSRFVFKKKQHSAEPEKE
jgi:putative flippase GtrA